MLNNLTNFFNLIVGRRIKTQLEPSDLIAVGTKQSPALGDYKPTAIKFEDLQEQLGGLQTVVVDGVTITGNATTISPLVAAITPPIGTLIGGGILVAVWVESGVKKGLIASLTNLATALPWTTAAFTSTLIGVTSQSFYDGSSNTSAIIAQTGVSPTTAYAAGIARLYLGGGFSDWYLPSSWELSICYSNATIVNTILGVNGFTNAFYWSSTENGSDNSWGQFFNNNGLSNINKAGINSVRAVRIHTF
jgi:hypothetical protein